jgi:preprotein translocase subunit SecG
MTLLTILCYILFVIAAIVLIVVVLLQEGRGGGFGEALGSHGRETFGVGSKGINTFTAWTAGIFLGSALVIHVLNREAGDGGLDIDAGDVVPSMSAPADSAPPAPPAAPSGN